MGLSSAASLGDLQWDAELSSRAGLLAAMAMVGSSLPLFLCSLCAGGTNSFKMCKMCIAQAFPHLDTLLRHLVHAHVCGNGHRQSGQLRVLGFRAAEG